MGSGHLGFHIDSSFIRQLKQYQLKWKRSDCFLVPNNNMSSHRLCQVLSWVLYPYDLLQEPYEVGNIVISTLQMGQLRHKEVK